MAYGCIWHIPGIHNFSWTCLWWLFTFYHEIHHHLEYLTYSLFYYYIEIFHWSDLVKLGIIKHRRFHFLETQHSIGFLKGVFNSLCIHLVLNCSTVAIWKHVVSCWLTWFRDHLPPWYDSMFKEFQLATSEEVYGSQFPYKYQVSHDISNSVVKWTHYDCIVGGDNHARPLPPNFCRPWSIIFPAVFQEDVVFKTNKPRCGDGYKEDDDEVQMRWSSQVPQCCMIIHVAVYIYVYIYIHT